MSSSQRNSDPIAAHHLELLLRGLIVLAIIAAFVEGPKIEIGYIGLYLFDLIVVLISFNILIGLKLVGNIRIPRDELLLNLTTIYFLLVVILPLVGIIVHDHPLAYVVGDIRWLQMYLIGLVIITLYSRKALSFRSDFVHSFKFIIGIYFGIFLLQLALYLDLYDTTPLLEFWFLNQSTYGELGHHIGRFSGAGSSPSLIGLVSLLGTLIFGHTFLNNGENKIFVLISLTLLVASGQRTAFVATVLLASLLITFHTGTPTDISKPKTALVSVGGLSVGFATAYRLNIGRLQSDNRFDELLTAILNPHKLPEVSGRGPRWESAISAMNTHYPGGTLANPAHVLDTETIDSYYVLALAQGHFLLLLIFLSFLLVAYRSILKYRYRNPQNALFAAILLGAVTILSSMQNFLTSITGKLTLVLSVCFIFLLYTNDS
ncbi:hypothetical protein [Natrialba swarupiae]|uniref:O-antigen ligase family protein n=1 Tax=Natrialba swarupiae TaxID=2448032 RepID=A0A5D5AMF3_9EURY|nr:hypothetical protein [Natrialba swarupiae]TYT60271.1 hypothetical protein FYC77_19765 [Natrialba swarupiae]